MEHLVTIAFDFDDKTVTDKIHATVEKTVIEKITKDVEKKLFAANWGWNGRGIDPDRDSLSMWTEGLVREVFTEHKDAIISKAAELLVDSFKRTKAWREAAQKAMCAPENGGKDG